ncbi:uncharacterized protein LOC122625167 [Drosophila teissieri]|uniref:uncharacterized protein LOC122625167 n=1 Tax=Drosophila teissieri TaxID=7243 RepID=UPI001CBA5559|nr:uncharacterized protein LOC122625167 [Drosophila teissieri]
MHNLIKSRALFEILKKPLPPNYFNDDGDKENSEDDTSNLSASAKEFVPRSKKEESSDDDESAVDLTEIKKRFEILDAQKTNAAGADKVDMDEIKKMFEDLDKEKSSAMVLPWKGFPRRYERPALSAQVVLIDDSDYVLVPRNKGKKMSLQEKLFMKNSADYMENEDHENIDPYSSEALPQYPNYHEKSLLARERRREQDRKVALEALKLVEQRRMRGPLVPSSDPGKENVGGAQPVVHLSRSPIRFSLEDRIKVDRLRAAKKERIEYALLEIANEKKLAKSMHLLQEQRKRAVNRCISTLKEPENTEAGASVATVATVATKRFIPTAKEWDEQRRIKFVKPEKNDVIPVAPKNPVATMTANRYIPTCKEWDEQRRAKHKAKMDTVKENIPAITKLPLRESNGVYGTTGMSSVFVKKVDPGTTAKPPCPLPTKELAAEKRKGNITHFQTIINWANRKTFKAPKMAIAITQQMESQQIADQREDRPMKKASVQRYSIEELLKLEPQPEDLEDPNIKAFSSLGIVCNRVNRWNRVQLI